MPIDFTDPAQVTHNGERIPIDTQEKYDHALASATAVYTAPWPDGRAGPAWDADMDQQFEQRVRNGMTEARIVDETIEDRNARYDAAQPK